MGTARLEVRIDKDIKAKAEKAYTLLGFKNLTEYIVKLMEEDATHVIATYEGITLEDNIFDQFIDACNQAKEPNAALLEAKRFSDNHEQ